MSKRIHGLSAVCGHLYVCASSSTNICVYWTPISVCVCVCVCVCVYVCVCVRERSEEHTSELQSHLNLVCRLLLEKKKKVAQLLCASAFESATDALRSPVCPV